MVVCPYVAEGKKARKAGARMSQNPYEHGTRAHSRWRIGWTLG